MKARAPRLLALGLVALSLASALAAGCGRASGLSAAGLGARKATAAVGVRAESGWEAATVLEDFQDADAPFEFFGPLSHPFFEPITFSMVKAKGANSVVLEALAQNRPKPRKGRFLNFEVEEAGSFLRGEEGKEQLAKDVKVGFRWAVNGADASEPSTFLEAVYVLQHKRLGPIALAYGWTSRACPGTIGGQLLQAGGKPIPMRIICLAQGAGEGQVCSEAALNAMKPVAVERNLVEDVRWAFAEGTQVVDLGVPMADCPPVPTQGEAQPVLVPEAFRGAPNTELLGILAVGGGAEVARGVCTHALLDDMWMQRRF